MPKCIKLNGLVSLAAILLVGCFALVACHKEQEAVVPMSIRLVSIPQDLVALDDPSPVEVKLSVPAIMTKRLNLIELDHVIDLSSARAGIFHVKLTKEMVAHKAPLGFSVVSITPDSFAIKLDNRIEKLVPVIPDFVNEPAPGFAVSRLTSSPSIVRLAGAASILEVISAIRTTPVDLAGLVESTRRRTALNWANYTHVEALNGNLVDVNVVIEEKQGERWVDAEVEGRGTSHKFAVSPQRLKLQLQGPVNTLKTFLRANPVRVYVDLSGLAIGTYVRPALIEPPLDTIVLAAKPEVFAVRIFD